MFEAASAIKALVGACLEQHQPLNAVAVSKQRAEVSASLLFTSSLSILKVATSEGTTLGSLALSWAGFYVPVMQETF